ncbi:glycosyltransferase [Azospirillum largimobile]
MKTSIVINTYNRAPQLRDCLRALRNLHGQFEVVVVNGPSTDGTKAVCEEYRESITYVECTERNLSISRNIGIANAVGEIIAFIDDDAVVHPRWLEKILEKYNCRSVIGVGGFTIDHTGKRYQATATLCDRLGNAYTVPSGISQEAFCFPGSPMFPSLLGTNSSFRAAALKEIGGFDETFAYFLDETDVCLRLVDRGGQIVYAPEALIYHRYAPSHLRNLNKVPTTLHVPSRSKVYFMYRHGTSTLDEITITDEVVKYRDGLRRDNRWLRDHNYLSPTAEALLNQDVEFGIEEGRTLARLPAPTKLADRVAGVTKRSFKGFNNHGTKRLRIALISQGFPPSDTAGIARWTDHVANGLAAKGHQVHVITRAETEPTVDYNNGVWVHKVRPIDGGELRSVTALIDLPDHLARWSAGVFAELRNIGFSNLDLVSAPIWDVEGLIPLLLSPIPVVTSLHTTYKLACPHKPDWKRPLYNFNHVQRVIKAEHFLFEQAQYFLGNTNAVVNEIYQAYGVDISSRTIVVPHGVTSPARCCKAKKDDAVTVLFVGRQETRKGFDTALKAALEVCTQAPDIVFRFIGSPTDDQNCKRAISDFMESAPPAFAKRISLEGYLPDDELNDAYADCDIFLAPSRFESFGLVAIEAMRYGKPVVAGNVGGLAEVIDQMKTGLLVNPDDSGEIAQAILRLAGDRSLRLQLGDEARRTFLSKYTLEQMVDSIEGAYLSFQKAAASANKVLEKVV